MIGEEYDRVRSALFSSTSGSGGGLFVQPDFTALLPQFPEVSYDTLVSIFAQDCVSRVKVAHAVHRRPERVEGYCERWRAGESLVDISETIDFPPCNLARLLLPSLLPAEAATGRVSKILADPESLIRVPDQEGGEGLARLASEVRDCVERDHVSSPLVASVKRAIGLEYESILYQHLESADLAFETEGELRKKGATKTPDALLKIPFMMGDRVVHWIDSKACFCSEELYYQEGVRQFKQYVNRFGPGLVIYWFGYLEGIPPEDGITISDSFPSEVTRL